MPASCMFAKRLKSSCRTNEELIGLKWKGLFVCFFVFVLVFLGIEPKAVHMLTCALPLSYISDLLFPFILRHGLTKLLRLALVCLVAQALNL